MPEAPSSQSWEAAVIWFSRTLAHMACAHCYCSKFRVLLEAFPDCFSIAAQTRIGRGRDSPPHVSDPTTAHGSMLHFCPVSCFLCFSLKKLDVPHLCFCLRRGCRLHPHGRSAAVKDPVVAASHGPGEVIKQEHFRAFYSIVHSAVRRKAVLDIDRTSCNYCWHLFACNLCGLFWALTRQPVTK